MVGGKEGLPDLRSISLRAFYAMSGTDILYAATRVVGLGGETMPGGFVSASAGATQCPVLTSRMELPGDVVDAWGKGDNVVLLNLYGCTEVPDPPCDRPTQLLHSVRY
eukprot:1403247-Rhodomonas_salina.3